MVALQKIFNTRQVAFLVLLLGIVFSFSGMSQEMTADHSKSERKCAQHAVYAVAKILGHGVDWPLIDEEFGGEGDVSFASIRDFFERRGASCFSAQFQKNNLRSIDSFFTSKDTSAIGVVLSEDCNDRHYVLIHKMDRDSIYLLDPLYSKLLKVPFSEWQSDVPLNVLFITYNSSVAKEWYSHYRMFTDALMNFGESFWLTIGLLLSIFVFVFPRSAPIKFNLIRHPVIIYLFFFGFCFVLTFIIVIRVENFQKTESLPLVFDPVEVKLGRQIIGKTLQFDFHVKNTSSETMEVSDSKSTCSCLDFQLSRDKVLPGDSVNGTGSLKISQIGKSINHMLITYGARQAAWLPIEYEGYEDLKITPATVNVGCFSQRRRASHFFEFEIQFSDTPPVSDRVDLELSKGIRDLFNVSCTVLEIDFNVIRLGVTMDYLGVDARKTFIESLSIFFSGNPRTEFVVQLFGEVASSEYD